MKKILAIFMTLAMLLGTFAMLPVFAADGEGWDGKTATKPEGQGTENDPYIIASAENFYWIQQNTPVPDNNAAYGMLRECPPSFRGVYFEQVCDIDFNGKSMRAIGGYAVDNAGAADANKKPLGIYVGGFGGTYNGNGYALKNLNVTEYSSNKTNTNWCVGLFASIWGATLKNMVLDNVTVTSTIPAAGILVGKAFGPTVTYDLDASGNKVGEWKAHPDSDNFEFNLIENIVIKDNCVANSTVAHIADNPNTADKDEGFYKVTSVENGTSCGSIAGVAVATTIRNCVSNATINVQVGATAVGGIVGQMGASVLIENCIFDGAINVAKTPDYLKDGVTTEVGFGGIAGGNVCGTYNGSLWHYRAPCTGNVIRGCVFSGSMTFASGNVMSGNAVHIGGILGGLNTLNIASNSTAQYPYLIENCINAGTMTYTGVTFGSGNGKRVGGIVGSGWCGGGAKAGTLYVKDCLSLDVAQNAYYGTNEFRCQGNATSAGLQHIVPLGLNAQVLGENDTYTAYAAKANVDKTLGTFTATTDKVFELVDGTYVRSATVTVQDKIDAIVADVAEAQEKATTSVVALGYQAATAGGAYRLILGTHSLRHGGYGVEVDLTVDDVAAEKAPDHKTHVAYSSILGNVADGENGMKQVTYTAKELGVEYLSTLTVSDIATTGTSVYTFKTYTFDSEGVKTYGDTIVMTFVDGAFASVAVNPQ